MFGTFGEPLGNNEGLGGNPTFQPPPGGYNFATTGAPGGGHQDPKKGGGAANLEKKLREDQVHFEKLAKLTPEERATRLKGRMEQLLKINPEEKHWCPFGDWCEKVVKTGDCTGRHTKAEFGRLIRKFQSEHPALYKTWTEKREAKQKEQEKKQKEKAASQSSTAPK